MPGTAQARGVRRFPWRGARRPGPFVDKRLGVIMRGPACGIWLIVGIMHLTSEQERWAAGQSGAALGLAMRTLIDYGKAFGAKRMVPVKSAHLAGSFGVGFMKAYYDILERLVKEGVRVKVPTTVNPRPGHELSLANRVAFNRQKRLEEMFSALGVTPNYSCVCYED